MSSRDIGPALPPHMKKSQGETYEDTKNRIKRYGDKERNGNRKDEHKRHREKYDVKGRRHDDEREKRAKYVPASSSSNRSRGLDGKKETSSGGERDKEREILRRERMKKEIDRDPRNPGSSRCSKRSKTDRTYNTDTEESSDGADDNQELIKVRDIDFSESDSEKEGADTDCSDTLFLRTKPATSGSPGRRPTFKSSYVIGPALPPHLSKVPAGNDSDNELDSPHTSATCSEPEASTPHLGSPVHQAEQNEAPESIGPALPPHLLSKQTEETIERSIKTAIGPSLPPHLRGGMGVGDELNDSSCIGPALPPDRQRTQTVDQDDFSSSIGPLLPPHLLKKSIDHQIGPSLPPALEKAHGSHTESEHKSSVIGPALPPQLQEFSVASPALPPGMKNDAYSNNKLVEDSSDDEVLGPLLPEEMTKSGKNYMIQAQLERNAAAIKRKFEEKDSAGAGTSRREEWMLELPPEGSVDLGLGARTFRAKGAPEKGADRSMWTDTPADKARKEEEAKCRFELGISSTDEIKKVAVSRELSGKDKSMEAVVKKHKRSKESMLDSHQKKIKEEKKKKEKSGVKQERRPFNRETDLKTNVFDDAQKKSIFKKAQLLDSRFSRGESKFL